MTTSTITGPFIWLYHTWVDCIPCKEYNATDEKSLSVVLIVLI